MTSPLPQDALALLKRLGVTDAAFAATGLAARSPITGESVATLRETSAAEAAAAASDEGDRGGGGLGHRSAPVGGRGMHSIDGFNLHKPP